MVSDESLLPITFYNRSSHMHDMPRKLTLIESLIGYLVRPITRVSMPSLHGWFQVAGFPLNSMIPPPPPLKLGSLRTPSSHCHVICSTSYALRELRLDWCRWRTLALLYTQTVRSQVIIPLIICHVALFRMSP